jgi:hypothetical protein
VRKRKYAAVYSAIAQAPMLEWTKAEGLTDLQARALTYGVDRQCDNGMFGDVIIETVRRKDSEGISLWFCKRGTT